MLAPVDAPRTSSASSPSKLTTYDVRPPVLFAPGLGPPTPISPKPASPVRPVSEPIASMLTQALATPSPSAARSAVKSASAESTPLAASFAAWSAAAWVTASSA